MSEKINKKEYSLVFGPLIIESVTLKRLKININIESDISHNNTDNNTDNKINLKSDNSFILSLNVSNLLKLVTPNPTNYT